MKLTIEQHQGAYGLEDLLRKEYAKYRQSGAVISIFDESLYESVDQKVYLKGRAVWGKL
ncbi:hypothetical protein A2U01_0103279 [Trifolium medium]|uniref:Uncharacterized protein n=1 Tax=Trifolium medium TaxID=97028 RepID=A0A392V504_9FABA|nr:hypothetical protein [Trifolium medium]